MKKLTFVLFLNFLTGGAFSQDADTMTVSPGQTFSVDGIPFQFYARSQVIHGISGDGQVCLKTIEGGSYRSDLLLAYHHRHRRQK